MEPTRNPPGRDDFYIRLQAVEGELEPDLVIPFPGATMRHEAAGVEVGFGNPHSRYAYLLTTLPISDSNHSSGNDRPR
jgi:hypothetical protein